MSQAATATLNKIGTSVRVDLDRIRDRVPGTLLKLLTNNPRGKVVDYKMTDGMGIGVVLELSDGSISWFFSEELI